MFSVYFTSAAARDHRSRGLVRQCFVPHGPMVKASGYDYVTTSGWNQKIPGSTPGGEALFLLTNCYNFHSIHTC